MAEPMECSYCQDAIDIATTDHMSLKCGHTFHKDCLKRDVDVNNAEVESLRCPVCKNTGYDMSLQEQELHAAHPSTFEHVVTSPINLAMDAASATGLRLDALMDAVLPGLAFATPAAAAAASPAASPGIRAEGPEGAEEDLAPDELSVAAQKLWRSGSIMNDVAPYGSKVIWEYAEYGSRLATRGWFEMHAEVAKQLEEVFADYEPTWLRITRDDDNIWKFDLVGMTQRRIKDGKDECTRRIRRIFVRDDSS